MKSDAERIPMLDMRLAPECSANPALAQVCLIRAEENAHIAENARWREAENARYKALHDEAIQRRVERLKRGEITRQEAADQERTRREYARGFVGHATRMTAHSASAFMVGASYYPQEFYR